MGWTILGTMVPGTGLVAAGVRRTGTFLLGLLALAAAALAAAAFVGDPVKRFAGMAVDPQTLLNAALAVGFVALCWSVLIVATNSRLRRYANLTSGQRAFNLVVVLALIAGVLVPAYKVSSYAMIQRDLVTSLFSKGSATGAGGLAPNAEAADPWAKIPRVNVLMIGSDAGEGRQGTRPDTLILASIDTKSGNTVLFSLPRNLQRVPFPLGTPGNEAWPDGFYCADGRCLLNAVWQWGQQNKDEYYPDEENPGLTATSEAVEGVLGLKVHFYSMVNLKGFQDFVDALGGVTVDVKKDLPIGGSSENPRAEGWIRAGKNQKLDGFEALWFARSRWSTDDFDRMRRQRCVIGAVVQQADPYKLGMAFPKLAATAKDNVSTDIRQQDLQAWITLALRIKNAKVRSLPFDDKVVPDRVNPDYDAIRELAANALKPPVKRTPDAGTPADKPSAGPDDDAGDGSTGGPRQDRGTDGPPKKADPTEAQDIKDVC